MPMTSFLWGAWAFALPGAIRATRTTSSVRVRRVRIFQPPESNVDDDLQCVVGSLDIGPKCFVSLLQFEVVGDDKICQYLSRAHERQRPPGVHPAFAPRRIDPDIASDREIHVHLHWPRVPRHHADAAAALDVLERLLHGGRAAGALEDGVGSLAVGDLAHAIGQVLLPHVDRKVSAQTLTDLQARVAGAGQDDALRAEGLAELHRDEANGPRPEN